MPCLLDHIVVVAQSLADGADFVERSLGTAPGPGRRHAHMGTHNLLLSLGASVYLEVVAIDPGAGPIGRPRWFGLDRIPAGTKPRLAAWVARTDAIQLHAHPELGRVETMEREGLTWHMTMTIEGDAPLCGAAPLLIQRETTHHPASKLPDLGFRLQGLHIRHPDPASVAQLLARIELAAKPEVAVEEGAVVSLVARIATPSGVMTLGAS
ncbi:MAG: VOC family protein [Ideonella sp.]|nr:VOC family protein [Ideonella sp.]